MGIENYNYEIIETFTVKVINDELMGKRIVMNWTENGEKKGNNVGILCVLDLIEKGFIKLPCKVDYR